MGNYKSKIFQAILILGVLYGTSSCMNNKPEDTKVVAEDHNDAKFDNNKIEKDAQFLVNAATISREEINLGQLAQHNGRSLAVKELGKMMEDEHTKSLADLTVLAKAKNISIPTSQTNSSESAYKNLNDKSGNDFDKAYADMIVSEHKKTISLFETAATESSDLDIRAWANSTLPALRKHLDHSMTCQTKCASLTSNNY